MSTLERMAAILPANGFVEAPAEKAKDGILTLELGAEALAQALPRLTSEAGFETITFVTAIDHMDADGNVRGKRFEVCYQFLSLAHGDRVRLLLGVEENDPKAPTATKAFAGAAFMERECFDMFGIVFEGHDNLRRLLMPEAFEHYPLRKDFPHRGIEPDKLYNQWNRERGGAPS
jgi:NADH-quinone oxidoreductase subunit C